MAGTALAEHTRLLRLIAKSLSQEKSPASDHTSKSEQQHDDTGVQKLEKYSDAWWKYWENWLVKSPLTCECRVLFQRIGHVAAAEHTFSADVFVEVEFQIDANANASFVPESFDPRISFPNISDEVSREDWCTGGDPLEKGLQTIRYKTRVRGTFQSHMYMYFYPVDYQKLAVWVTSDWSRTLLRLIPGRKRSVMNEWAWNTIRDEWTVVHKIHLTSPKMIKQAAVQSHVRVSSPEMSASKTIYTNIRFRVVVIRKMGYFFWNIIGIAFVLASLAFTSFYVPPGDVADRSSITLTILLTVVAFKQSVSQDLPKATYLTLLDTFLIFVLFTVSAIVVMNALIGYVEDPDDQKTRDDNCFIAISAFWICGNLAFTVFFVHTWRQRRVLFQTVLQEVEKDFCEEASLQTDKIMVVPSMRGDLKRVSPEPLNSEEDA